MWPICHVFIYTQNGDIGAPPEMISLTFPWQGIKSPPERLAVLSQSLVEKFNFFFLIPMSNHLQRR